METRNALRKRKRAARNQLTEKQQLHASKQLAKLFFRSGLFWRSKHVALYIASDGELDPLPIAETCWRLGKSVYLPVLHETGDNRLRFALWQPSTRLVPNRYGILEPHPWRCLPPWALNLVLLPLVAFDPQGGRMGMGGGFYDKTFAFTRRSPLRPKLFGLAHECQRVDQLPVESWDIPLDGIFSDRQLYLPANNGLQ